MRAFWNQFEMISRMNLTDVISDADLCDGLSIGGAWGMVGIAVALLVSEMMGVANCKSNGIIHALARLVRPPPNARHDGRSDAMQDAERQHPDVVGGHI